VVDRRKNADFVEGIFLLFVTQFNHLDFLEGVCIPVLDPLHVVNARVGAFSQAFDNLKVVQ